MFDEQGVETDLWGKAKPYQHLKDHLEEEMDRRDRLYDNTLNKSIPSVEEGETILNELHTYYDDEVVIGGAVVGIAGIVGAFLGLGVLSIAIGGVGASVALVVACSPNSIANRFHFVKDWRDCKRHRFVGREGEVRIQSRFRGQWLTLSKRRYVARGFRILVKDNPQPVLFNTLYEAQEFRSAEIGRLAEQRCKDYEKKLEQERVERERNKVLGEVKQ